MRFLTYTAVAIFSFFTAATCLSAQVTSDAAPEMVHLGYELTLTRCKANDCHTDSAAKGVADIALTTQGADGMSGTQTVQMHTAGVDYSVVIKASSDTSSSAQSRHVDVTLTGLKSSGESAGLSFKAHEAANCVAWNTLPLMTLPADTYTENGEQVTPALHLKVVAQ